MADFLARVLGGDLLAATPGPDNDFWYQPAGHVVTSAGMRVDEQSAQKLSAWFRGKDILSTSLAMLPLKTYERLPDGQGATVARRQPLYDVLHTKPNPWQDSFRWRRQAMRHLIDHGAAYSRIVEGRRGFVDELHPIHPALVRPEQLSSGRVVFHIRDEKRGTTTVSTQDDIFWLLGASDDGVHGMGILQAARQSLGTAMATESYAASVFGRGTINGGVITVPTKLDPTASKNMAESFITSAGNWALPKVLEQGATWVQSEMSPEDFQMLLSRKFSVTDIARWLGLPPHMLGDLDKSSFSNIEHQGQEFVTYSLGPWLSMWEFACSDQLVLNTERFYVEFERDALVRGDIATRWEAHLKSVHGGIKTVDEVRVKEGLNKRGGKADELRQPQNITGKPAAAEPDEDAPKAPAKRPAPVEDDDADQARAIVVESAARVLRKEIKAMQKLAVQFAADGDAWAAAVTDFYTRHAELLGETLLMSKAAADAYCAGQASQVLVHGIAVVESAWTEPTYAKGLAAWALEREAAA